MKIRNAVVAGAWLAATVAVIAQAMASGQVRKIDTASGRITIEHGGVANLDMPPMTMVFKAKDPSALASLKPGDKVQFTAEKIGGTYTLTSIRRP